MEETKKACPGCGAENQAVANVCLDCGSDLAAPAETDTETTTEWSGETDDEDSSTEEE